MFFNNFVYFVCLKYHDSIILRSVLCIELNRDVSVLHLFLNLILKLLDFKVTCKIA